MKQNPFYITTPIYYVNGAPHLGHGYTSVVSDIFARFQRLEGNEVYFLTGTDEHGQKVEQTAKLNNKSPIEFANEISTKFQEMNRILCCSTNDFIRTTEERHKEKVLALWEILEKKGQIYLGSYEGWYSVRDEAFYTEAELVDGKAPTGATVEWLKEESYFFRLSDYTQRLLDYYDSHPDFIGPKARRNEVISFINQPGGLRDLSISRTSFHWGIPVKSDPKHVVYVWLDALTNYLSALGLPDLENRSEAPGLSHFWPPALQVVGKDILRFHAIYWPAFLLAAELPLPKRIFAHGWWTREGLKMSKSIGNVLCPLDLVRKYGPDYLRYFFASEITFGNDGDFSEASFVNRINGDLANDYGNLIHRSLSLISKNCGGEIPLPSVESFYEEDLALLTYSQRSLLPRLRKHMEKQELKAYVDEVITLSSLANKYIDVQAPWELKKQNKMPRFDAVLFTLSEVIRQIAVLLSPIIPSSSELVFTQLGIRDEVSLKNLASLTLSPEIAPEVPSFHPPQLTFARNQPLSIDHIRLIRELIGKKGIIPLTPLLLPLKPIFPKLENTENVCYQNQTEKHTHHKLNQASTSPADYSTQQLADMIISTGKEIRTLKNHMKVQGKSTTQINGTELQSLILKLKSLKDRYQSLSGISFDATKYQA